jgi:NAD(P)-dependent dehydrogenase (short-subunit alcohol dehydrogenase family)
MRHARVVCAKRDFEGLRDQINQVQNVDGVIWAQGINTADSVINFELDMYENLINANVSYILNSLKLLLDAGILKKDSQLVVISSVWGQLSRPSKLSYGISKAALGGLVRSLATDLGPLGIQINAVSPGPIDTPMTIKNLMPEELERVISESPIKRLVTLAEVTSIICELATGKLSGVTGQEIIIDGGWSVSKLV